MGPKTIALGTGDNSPIFNLYEDMYEVADLETTYIPTLPTFESLRQNLVEDELPNSALETSESRFSPRIEATEEADRKSTFETLLGKSARRPLEPVLEDMPAATRRLSMESSWKPLGEPVEIPGAARNPRQISKEEIAASQELGKTSTVVNMLGSSHGVHASPSNHIVPLSPSFPSQASPLATDPTHPSMIEQRSSVFEHLHHFRDGRGNFQFFQLGKKKEPLPQG